MKKNLFTLLMLVVLFTTNLSSQIQSNGTGGGDWNTIATWQGGVIPGASDNVVILGTDTVTLAAAGSCANLTLNGGETRTIGYPPGRRKPVYPKGGRSHVRYQSQTNQGKS